MDINLENCYADLDACDLQDVSIRLNIADIEEWETNIRSKPKLRTYTYIQFKQTVDSEQYVLLIFLEENVH